ncbi:hypothetical protein [Bifidobacterium vespertilionis]|uniref:Uncharacterized protein n=1 Tax=Bifidobacterium vespertilionis TaxID=2562524 RepID=A0A5J5DSE7_9BIFI|nr:hypothetical protein [Bifidobacterium vespertilionis]KAA8816714.1 hypothetical protein EMO90_11415 [Bifidobacterium vespertilionis]KAA8821762.1 hypothetical protein EM848_10240 [Bifidobacterium vespertilionis]
MPLLYRACQLQRNYLGIDARGSWFDAVATNHEQCRAEQLRALMREYPDIIYETLQAGGLLEPSTRINRPKIPDRMERLRRY